MITNQNFDREISHLKDQNKNWTVSENVGNPIPAPAPYLENVLNRLSCIYDASANRRAELEQYLIKLTGSGLQQTDNVNINAQEKEVHSFVSNCDNLLQKIDNELYLTLQIVKRFHEII